MDTPVVALLQAVNLGRYGQVPMARLREVTADLGHRNVSTWLATGNLLLRPRPDFTGDRAALVTELTEHLRAELDLPLGLVIRTLDQMEAVIAANPYPQAAAERPSRLVVMFYDGPVAAGSPDLSAYGPESTTFHHEEGYIDYREGIGSSRLTGKVLDRAAGGKGSGRNWNTVLAVTTKLRALGTVAG
ncbi:DUF1697 domain-containing protein [Cellulomonas sp. NPDC089187]|uniref:DUF1697 domain-containing protein n=1 Tax=Cellulomonas sp. NPDC089187 TaxID=3154970 RepID=UPI00343C49D8